MELAARVDALVARRPELKSSGVYLFDTQGAQQGGYTSEELIQRIKEIQEISDKHKLNVLSIAIAANSSPKSTARVGLNDSHDVMIVYFRPNINSNKRAVVTWLKAAKTADLDKTSIDEIVKSLTAAIEPNDSGPGRQ